MAIVAVDSPVAIPPIDHALWPLGRVVFPLAEWLSSDLYPWRLGFEAHPGPLHLATL